MIGQMVIATALPGFNDLGCPMFLLMDHFLYRFSTFSEKIKKIYQLHVSDFFYKMHHRIPIFLALRYLPLEGVSFVTALETFEIINARDWVVLCILNYANLFLLKRHCI